MLKFDEQWQLDSVNGALSIREDIEKIVDEICEEGYRNICWLGIGGTYASAQQAEIHMKEFSGIDFFVENAAEYLTTGNKRVGEGTVVIIASESGTTKEMIKAVDAVHAAGAKVLGFIDNADATLAKMVDYVISYPFNEQLKFFMAADRFMYNNDEFEDYYDQYENFEQYLAQALVDAAKAYEPKAIEFAKRHMDDDIHYFVGAGNQMGATYSYAMCYWEEQHWIRSKSIHSAEFFHGMFEIVERDTNVTVFVGEDSQRALSERVANFLPQICGRYNILDTKDFELKGIKEKYRGHISHLVMRVTTARIDVHIERLNRHPMEIRRYYRQLEY